MKNIRITDEDHARLLSLADEEGRKMYALVTLALDAYEQQLREDRAIAEHRHEVRQFLAQTVDGPREWEQ